MVPAGGVWVEISRDSRFCREVRLLCITRQGLNQFALPAEDQAPILPRRRQSVFADVGQKHVLTVPRRPRP
jgi:hypothetical protein